MSILLPLEHAFGSSNEENIIARYEDSLRPFERCHIVAEVNEEHTTSLQQRASRSRYLSDVVIDGPRLNSITKTLENWQLDTNDKVENATINQELWDGKEYFHYNASIPLGFANVVIGDPADTTSTGNLRASAAMAYIPGRELRGYVVGSTKNIVPRLRDALKGGNCVASSKHNGGVDTDVITARIPQGVLEVQFNKGSDGNISELILDISQQDDFYGQPLSVPTSLPAFVLRNMKKHGVPTEPDTHIRLVCDQVKYLRQQGISYASTARISQITSHEDGASETDTKIYKVVSMDFSPDFTALKAFEPNFKEGANVAIEKHTSVIPLQWSQGRVTARIDVKGVETLNDQIRTVVGTVNDDIASQQTSPSTSQAASAGPLDLKLVGPKSAESNEKPLTHSGIALMIVLICVLVFLIVGLSVRVVLNSPREKR
jgi:hypothetical protein